MNNTIDIHNVTTPIKYNINDQYNQNNNSNKNKPKHPSQSLTDSNTKHS